MRSLPDRIRHTVLFEGIALGLVAFGGSAITGQPVERIGALGIMFSILAMTWNLTYNWLFDQWDARYRQSAPRGVGIRVVHAILFEIVLLTVGVFLIAWWLEIGYVDALIMDIGFSAFFLCYAFAYNWLYDIVFPVSRDFEKVTDAP